MQSVAVLGQLREQELDGDLLVEPGVGRSDHHAHAALAQDLVDSVLAVEDIAFGNRGSHGSVRKNVRGQGRRGEGDHAASICRVYRAAECDGRQSKSSFTSVGSL